VLRRENASKPDRQANGLFSDASEVPLQELVPGDVVQLSAGDLIPGDLRLLEARDLFVSQSALTGEAMPVEKNASGKASEGDSSKAVSLLDETNLCFAGSSIVSGTGKAVIIATGNNTYLGGMAATLAAKRPVTAFDKGVNKVSWLLIRFMLVMVPVVFLINGLIKGTWLDAFFFAIAVAVGLTPEMLPMIVNANLARGAMAMAKQKAIVKRLNAIQNFGAMDVLCTDKTGTLTQDRVALIRHLDANGLPSRHVLEFAYLNSLFQTGLKNLLDRAVIDRAHELGLRDKAKEWSRIDEIPFDFSRRRMSVVLSTAHQPDVLICKGAVEEMLTICSQVEEDGKIEPLSEIFVEQLKKLRDELNRDGLRVIAVAYKNLPPRHAPVRSTDESALIFCGFVAFLDPPKDSAAEAIRLLHEHGVAIKVLTGDNGTVACKVCRDVGLTPGLAVEGASIEGLSDPELSDLAEKTCVFAKLTPYQKARVVRLLKQRGHTVGFMGDGINDAMALKESDVGISVDSAVDVAKESADIILLEKSLLVLERGVVEGRRTFGNIVKYIKMTASSNFGNVFSVVIASAFLPFMPMLAIQLLVQNLLYDLSQISIPWDRMDEDFIKKPRPWEAETIKLFMLWIGPISSVFDIITFLVMWHFFGFNSPEKQALFQTGWFVVGLLTQTSVVHMIRTERIPFFQSTASGPVLLLTGFIMAVGIWLPFSPLAHALHLTPLPGAFFLFLPLVLLGYCLSTQLMKRLFIRRFGRWL
jgi:Mg2+-importing ATPase